MTGLLDPQPEIQVIPRLVGTPPTTHWTEDPHSKVQQEKRNPDLAADERLPRSGLRGVAPRSDRGAQYLEARCERTGK